jgi:hypothetical protein
MQQKEYNHEIETIRARELILKLLFFDRERGVGDFATSNILGTHIHGNLYIPQLSTF